MSDGTTAKLSRDLAAAQAEAARLREALVAIRRCPADARADWPEILEWIDREAAAALSATPGADAYARRIRREALEEAASVAQNACLVPPDGGSPSVEEAGVCAEAALRIRALIEREDNDR